MYISDLNINNFRNINSIVSSFLDRLTILSESNEKERTDLLDATAIMLSTFFNEFREFKPIMLRSLDSSNDKFPICLSSIINIDGNNFKWTRTLDKLNGNNKFLYSQNLTEDYQNRLMNGDPTLILPVLAYYDCDKFYNEIHYEYDFKVNTRTNGYIGALCKVHTNKFFKDWRTRVSIKNFINNRISKDYIVIEDLKYNLAEIDKTSFTTIVDDNIVLDIACRMATLNPQLEENILNETQGIILIDHFNNDKNILNLLIDSFPKVQFIISNKEQEFYST